MADEATYDCSVLLLNPCLVVLSMGSSTCELDALGLPVRQHRLVDELAPVVGVEAAQGERHRRPQPRQRLDDQRTFLDGKRDTLGPPARDVGEREREREAAGHVLSAMGHEVGFHEAGQRVVPIAERPNRDRVPDGELRARPRPPSIKILARGSQQAVDRRSAHREQLLPYSGLERQVAVSLECRHEHRKQRLEPFDADPVGCLTENDEPLANASSYSRKRGGRAATASAVTEFRTRIECLRWYPVTATNPSRIRALSSTAPERYRSPIARTSSRRVSTLILFAIVASSELPPRVADSVRQRVGEI